MSDQPLTLRILSGRTHVVFDCLINCGSDPSSLKEPGLARIHLRSFSGRNFTNETRVFEAGCCGASTLEHSGRVEAGLPSAELADFY